MPAPTGKPAAPARKGYRWLWFVAPPAVAATVSLLGAVFPGGSLYVWSYALFFWILVAVGWVVLLLLPRYRKRLGIVVAPLLALLTYGVVAADLPIRMAFAVSEPALSAYVRSLPLHPEDVTMGDVETGLGVEWVGVFPVGRAARHLGSTDLGVVGAGGWLEFCGLTYVTGDRTQKFHFSSVDHLSGDWYVTCEDF